MGPSETKDKTSTEESAVKGRDKNRMDALIYNSVVTLVGARGETTTEAITGKAGERTNLQGMLSRDCCQRERLGARL